jgi:hypothetical protein
MIGGACEAWLRDYRMDGLRFDSIKDVPMDMVQVRGVTPVAFCCWFLCRMEAGLVTSTNTFVVINSHKWIHLNPLVNVHQCMRHACALTASRMCPCTWCRWGPLLMLCFFDDLLRHGMV